jgi:hypothetical protein
VDLREGRGGYAGSTWRGRQTDPYMETPKKIQILLPGGTILLLGYAVRPYRAVNLSYESFGRSSTAQLQVVLRRYPTAARPLTRTCLTLQYSTMLRTAQTPLSCYTVQRCVLLYALGKRVCSAPPLPTLPSQVKHDVWLDSVHSPRKEFCFARYQVYLAVCRSAAQPVFDSSGVLSFGQVTPKTFSTNSISRVSEGGVGSFAVNSLRDAGFHGDHSSSGAAR